MKYGAIVQSSYIPWKGYFDLIDSVDEFILYDDAQFTKRDWRSRNQIKGPEGLQWLSIPVAVKGQSREPIKDIQISDPKFFKKHWTAIQTNYGKSPFYKDYCDTFKSIYLDQKTLSLSQFNFELIKAICNILDIKTKISWSMDYDLKENEANLKLIEMCKKAGFNHYISGPAAKEYMDLSLFQAVGIEVSFFTYQGYPEYPQLFGEFAHNVTVLDVIFNTGPEARKYIKKPS